MKAAADPDKAALVGSVANFGQHLAIKRGRDLVADAAEVEFVPGRARRGSFAFREDYAGSGQFPPPVAKEAQVVAGGMRRGKMNPRPARIPASQHPNESLAERFGILRLPNLISSLCYESRKYCWVITTDGVILKANYLIPRWEMISTVQNPSPDTLKYLIAFDTKRNRVVVLRIRPDAADGACQIQLEFYYPMVKPAYLTQPVPVSSLRSGSRVILAANLIGDAGEGLTPYTVSGAMVAPVEGYLATPFSGTEMDGRVCFQYQAPDIACTETLQLSVTVEES